MPEIIINLNLWLNYILALKFELLAAPIPNYCMPIGIYCNLPLTVRQILVTKDKKKNQVHWLKHIRTEEKG